MLNLEVISLKVASEFRLCSPCISIIGDRGSVFIWDVKLLKYVCRLCFGYKKSTNLRGFAYLMCWYYYEDEHMRVLLING